MYTHISLQKTAKTKKIDLRAGPHACCTQMEGLTICIPRVGLSVTSEFIRDVFAKCNIGYIDRVRVIRGDETSKAFVHFRGWFRSARAKDVKEKLIRGEYIYVLYDSPWFWRCSKKR